MGFASIFGGSEGEADGAGHMFDRSLFPANEASAD
jgi:hypothetical protein